MSGPGKRVDVVLAGVHGHGRWHLRNIRRLAAGHDLRLVGVCDPRPLNPRLRAEVGEVPVAPRLEDLLSQVRPQVTIVCTPIHTHADLALRAAEAGSHVLLEKPPTPTLAEFTRLEEGIAASGVACQVGFQSLGSHALAAIRGMVADGAIGELRGIGAAGTWQRDTAYFTRSAWAGRRRLNGVPVVDGALTNPFAHATVTALALDGSLSRGALREVGIELYRANDIEADDTSALRLRTEKGTTITVAVTLCAEETRPPHLVVHGTKGRVTLAYKEGQVRLVTADVDRAVTYPATDLLLDLIEHLRDRSRPLLVPLAATGAFMEVVEAIRLAPDPLPIGAEHQRTVGEGETQRRVVPGVDALIARSAEELALFSELAPAWAAPRDERAGVR